jgi:immune inhibitor A
MATAMSITTVGSIKPNLQKTTGENLAISSYDESGTLDLAIANDEKLIEMLKKNGTIPAGATQDEAEKILRDYLKGLEKGNNSNPSALTLKEKQGLKDYEKEALENGFLNSPQQSKNLKSKNNVDGNTITKDKALVLLIEFPDYVHNSIQPTDTPMYYKDYTQQHFSDMIFGKDGYKGPNGEDLVSMSKFYDEQSGQTYEIEGTVTKWYTASKNAASYGAEKGSNHDIDTRSLIKEGLQFAAKDYNLGDYDLKDPYDLDQDGNINEKDGIIDHLMVIHSGMGQEAGGGKLGTDAIWSHSSKVYTVANGAAVPWKIPDTDLTKGMSAFPYTIMPEDGAAGVFAHEFGHDLGLPDEYDTNYSGAGEPIEYWSIMSGGSWAGKIPGTEPTGFSPYAKEFFQKKYGGKWQNAATIDYKDVTSKGTQFILDQASLKGKNNDVVKVVLPQKATVINTPAEGTYEYFSGKGDNYEASMSVAGVDLTKATKANLTFKTIYDIEEDFDYASIQVKVEGQNTWESIPGTGTTTKDPNGQNPKNGITGKSAGWIPATFDLTGYIGKKVDIKFNYWTDAGATNPGFYVDDIKINVDDVAVITDNAEGDSKFTLNKFTKNDGKALTDQYYLLEWRNQTGVDAGLGHIKRGKSIMSYDPGLLVWYVDDYYTDNWTGPVEAGGHPGNGYLGLVDADQINNKWSDGTLGTTRYQMNDAAFSIKKSTDMLLDFGTKTISDKNTFMHPIFDDAKHYLNNELPDAGRDIPKLGLKIYVTGENKDRSIGTIMIKK